MRENSRALPSLGALATQHQHSGPDSAPVYHCRRGILTRYRVNGCTPPAPGACWRGRETNLLWAILWAILWDLLWDLLWGILWALVWDLLWAILWARARACVRACVIYGVVSWGAWSAAALASRR